MMRLGRMPLRSPGSVPRTLHSSRRLMARDDVDAGTSTAAPRNVVIYDGVCNLCNGGVRFVARRSQRSRGSPRLKFCAAQGARGADVLRATGLSYGDVMNRFAYIDRTGVVHRASSAALEVAGEMDWPWPLAGVLLALPRSIRDCVYDIVARHRYRLFGRTDECQLPPEEFRDRFLE